MWWLLCGVTVDELFLLLFRDFWCCCRTFPQSTGEMRRWASSWLKRTDWSTCLQMHPATTGDRPETVSQQNQNLHWTGTRWTSGAASGPDISWCVWGNLKGSSRLKVESVWKYSIYRRVTAHTREPSDVWKAQRVCELILKYLLRLFSIHKGKYYHKYTEASLTLASC